MRTPLAAACLIWLLAACDQSAQTPVAPADEAEVVATGVSVKSPVPTSIIRPEVAEEASVPVVPEQPREPLRATIGFEGSGTRLSDLSRGQLDALMADARFAGGGAITLSGHSDASGNDTDNLVVSRRRAEAVRDYLVSRGASEDRITVIALGERRPIEPNANPDGTDYPEGRQRNRRVEVIVGSAVSASAENAPSNP